MRMNLKTGKDCKSTGKNHDLFLKDLLLHVNSIKTLGCTIDKSSWSVFPLLSRLKHKTERLGPKLEDVFLWLKYLM